ncbi:MAG: hypothetical protein KatS3mg042_0543 [Rhodothermaceae bacterium]|nr:MAG: hypothetical protein KatS3mg042_0543 [Rhodothermaceae bacterium]
MIQTCDKRIARLDELCVTQLVLNWAFTIRMWENTRSLRLTIEVSFELVSTKGDTCLLDPERSETLCPALNLLHKPVAFSEADRQGSLGCIDIPQMIELNDRWLLPLDGQTVARSYVYPGLTFDLEGEKSSYKLRMHGDTLFRDAVERERFIRAERWEEDAPDLIPYFEGKTIEQAFAYKNGHLEIHFEDGSTLEVLPNTQYESWELVEMETRRNKLLVIGLPGGDLAIWLARPDEE